MTIKQLPTGLVTIQKGNLTEVMTRKEWEEYLINTNNLKWLNNLKKTIQLCTR